MGLFVFVEQGVEFPGPEGVVYFAIRGAMFGGFEFGSQLCFGFRVGFKDCQLAISIGEGGRVIFLLGRLFFLVSLFSSAVELLAITYVKIARVLFVGLTMDLIDG